MDKNINILNRQPRKGDSDELQEGEGIIQTEIWEQ